MLALVVQVNAFTVDGVAATGNPAAVCLLESSLLGSMTASLRQSVATDINLSETAYIEAVRTFFQSVAA